MRWKELIKVTRLPPDKKYTNILPTDNNATIREQFGWLPTSIFKPERWDIVRARIDDSGDLTSRRGKNVKYLKSLRFSEFNPHLADIVIKYWSSYGDLIVDPFAGRGTRGIVALNEGRKYVGYEISPTTFNKYAKEIYSLDGKLIFRDGCRMSKTNSGSADLVFTCPPYHRLEKYESCPFQLSDIKDYDSFLKRIRVVAKNIYRVLKQNGFLCWVCADWREGGKFRLFHRDSLNIFEDVGLKSHDIVIVHNISPFTHLQAAKVASKRYTSKTHEYLLVFRKEK